ncbi:2,3-bisphosphoglycerate-independent phosphoglycerate mutase [Candidatus Uhrbacteria bacterium]|nr:2,3-bisphosphoglycerate-independent phosphoglycerate mutase [Candidatus Uhrbacteria bacterium]
MREPKKHPPVVLIVLDGWGHRDEKEHNAIAQARTPFLDSLYAKYPYTLLDASGQALGLPEGQAGTSEIGHLTIGAGRVIDTDLVRITEAMHKGEFETNQTFKTLFDHVVSHDSTLHILGLVSPGGIHSHSSHIEGVLHAAKNAGVKKIAIHAFTDGRDTPPQSGKQYLQELESFLEDLQIGFIASISGRFYSMDRDHNWHRVAKAEDAIFRATSTHTHQARPSEVIDVLYRHGHVDEHIEPIVFVDDGGKSYPVEKNDGAIFINFRADRARMLSRRFIDCQKEMNLCFATMTEYEKNGASLVAFRGIGVETTLAAEISKVGLRSVHIAETEKYAHATYFLNGGKEEPHEEESHVLIESRKDIRTHDEAPEMKAAEITDAALEYINEGIDFIFINYANADMVAHTANFSATIQAVECIDAQLQRLVPYVLGKGGIVCITADHGNAEVGIDPSSGILHTAHTTHKVPAILTMEGVVLRSGGGLRDIAPTILDIMGIPIPPSMTGVSLLESLSTRQ